MLDIKRLGFDNKELKDIGISTVILAFVFAYPGIQGLLSFSSEIYMGFLVYLIILFLVFIPHELAHKFTAIRYGCVARYQIMWDGLKFALMMAIITNGFFVIAAPGAVMISNQKVDVYGRMRSLITQKQNAYISMAGPAANIAVAAIMLILPGSFILFGTDMASSIGFVSAFLALFNLIPVGPLDGSKIMRYSKTLWLGMLLACIFLMGLF